MKRKWLVDFQPLSRVRLGDRCFLREARVSWASCKAAEQVRKIVVLRFERRTAGRRLSDVCVRLIEDEALSSDVGVCLEDPSEY